MAFSINWLKRKLTGVVPDGPQSYIYDKERSLLSKSSGAIPAAYAAITLLSSTMAQLPRLVVRVRDGADDDWLADDDHPISVLLRQPSISIDPWLFWEMTFRDLFSNGNAYAYIWRDPQDRPIGLIPATAKKVQWGRSSSGPRKLYDLDLVGSEGTLRRSTMENVMARDVIALHGPGSDGLQSPSPIAYAASRTLSLMEEAMTRQQAELSGPNLRNVITAVPELIDLAPEVLKDLKETLSKTYGEARQAGKVPALPPGFNISSTAGLSAVDMQIIQLLRYGVEDIARVFGLPPRVIGHYHEGFRATRYEAQQADFERLSIRHHARRIESEFSQKLLTVNDRSAGLTIRLPTRRIQEGTWAEMVESVGQAVSDYAVMTPNEGRRLLRLPSIEGGDKLRSPRGGPPQEAAAQSED